LVVPTYWTRAGGDVRPGDAVYDHPTPVDEAGTLGRLLESLTLLDTGRFYVVVIVAVTDPAVAAAAAARVRSIARTAPEMRVLVVDQDLVDRIERALGPGDGRGEAKVQGSNSGEGHDAGARALIGLSDYSRVRNLQLLVPLALGVGPIVAIDDDEVVTDPSFLDLATADLGDRVSGHNVAGLGGYYLQNREGQILLDVPSGSESAANIFDRKAAIMNAGTQKLQALAGAIVPTPFCFGGNMVFTAELAATVCFDPAITRGEDIDYLVNARLAGHWFFMNKDLTILHLPPSGGSYQDVAYHKVVQDVLRFVYEREKLQAWSEIGAVEPVTAEDLDPYPGLFLKSDLDGYAEEVIQRIIDRTSADQRVTLGLPNTPRELIRQAEARAGAGVESYRQHQEAWAALVGNVKRSGEIRSILEEAMFGGTGRAVV